MVLEDVSKAEVFSASEKQFRMIFYSGLENVGNLQEKLDFALRNDPVLLITLIV